MVGFPASHVSFPGCKFLKEVGPRSFVFENPIVDLAKFLLGMPTLFLSYGERERERERCGSGLFDNWCMSWVVPPLFQSFVGN